RINPPGWIVRISRPYADVEICPDFKVQVRATATGRRRANHTDLLSSCHNGAYVHPVVDACHVQMRIHRFHLADGAAARQMQNRSCVDDDDNALPRAVTSNILSIHYLPVRGCVNWLTQVVRAEAIVPV